jgi:hypothetical protein
MLLRESQVLGPCRVSSRITWLRRDGQSSTPDSSRLSHRSSSRARGLLLSSLVRSPMVLLRFIRVMRSSPIIISRLLCILVNTVVPRLRCPGPMVARRHKFIRVNIAARRPRLIRANIAAHHLRLILASTMDLHPNRTLQLGYSNSSSNNQDEFPLTPWNKTWTGCASAPLLLPPTQVYLVLRLRMDTPMKSKAALRRRQQQERQLELEPP